VEASALAQSTIARTRPLVYRQLVAEATEMLYLKVHDAWGLADDGTPLFPADVTAGVVYIVRNPLDVAGSFANHMGVELETVVEWMCSDSFVMASEDERIGDQLSQLLSSWSGHVRSWLDQSGLPHVIVRYEELHRQPVATLREVVRFCGLPVDDGRLGKAIAFSTFTELRRQELADGFAERLSASRTRFFRRGEVDCWCDELPEALARRLIEEHCETMRRLGYLGGEAIEGVMRGAGIGDRA
jgi:aryl sulfotransferase